MRAHSARILLFLLIIIPIAGQAQPLYFPPLSGDTWETMSFEEAGWCEENLDALLGYLDSIDTKAFIALQDGRIVLEQYFGTFTRDSFWHWASAGKTLTAFAVGKAQEQGFLQIEDPSSTYLGEGWTSLAPDQEDQITIRHQLTMTSGLDDEVDDPYCTLDTCLVYLADPGTRWAYHNAPYTLLDGVISNATGQNLNIYLQNVLKSPTGMDGLFLPIGYNNVYISKPRSMARFGLLILNNGVWDGNAVMEDQDYFHDMVNTSQDLNPSYGYLWWLNGKSHFKVPGFQFDIPGSITPNAPDDMIAAIGKDGQILNIVPSQQFLFIRMGNATGIDVVPIAMNNNIWARLNDVRCGTSASTDTREQPVQLFPNPVASTLHIKPGIQIHNLLIYNVFGREIPIDNNGNTVDVTELLPGIYFLRFTSSSRYYTKVFVKD